jgi:hypothetical protein
MWLILRWMPDAFQPHKLTATLAAVAAVAAGVTFVLAAERSGPPPIKVPGCGLDLAALRVTGCKLLKSDTSAVADPRPLWGRIDCASASRHQRITSGGDPHPTGDGSPQPDRSYRRLTALDGDQVFGERCELGANEYRAGFGRTFNLYGEGQHRVTFVSIRLPAGFPLSTPDWQIVMQMKQTQPSDNGNGTPVLALQAQASQWTLFHSASADESGNAVELWSAPATTRTWTRFAFDVVYSQSTSAGRVRVYADLNGDGDARDAGEQSPPMATYTLKRESAAETSPDDDPLVQGESIPSHLRTGLYHHDPIACPPPGGCPVEVDNVQVYAAP